MSIRKFAAVASLALIAGSAFAAKSTISDAELSEISGQDGVSIVADLKVNIGSIQYLNSTNGASLSLNGVGISGFVAATIDVLTGAQFMTAASAGLSARGLNATDIASVLADVSTATGYASGSDVVQIAFPTIASAGKALLGVSVASLSTGNGGNSMGGVKLNSIDLGGTKVWIYGHN